MKNRKSWPRIPPLHPEQNNHWWNYQQNSLILYDESFEISHFGEAAGKPCCSLTVWEKACPPYEFPCTSQRGFWKHLAARESYQIWPLRGLSLHSLLVILLFTFKKYNKNSFHLCWKSHQGLIFALTFILGILESMHKMSPFQFDAWLYLFLEKGMATHSSILAWRIPWTEKPGRVHAVGSQELDTTGWNTLFFLFGRRTFYGALFIENSLKLALLKKRVNQNLGKCQKWR